MKLQNRYAALKTKLAQQSKTAAPLLSDLMDTMNQIGLNMNLAGRAHAPTNAANDFQSAMQFHRMKNEPGAIGSALSSGLGNLLASPLEGMAGGISKGLSTALSAPGTTFGYRLDKMLNGGFGGMLDRIQAPDVAAKKFIETATGNLADKATDLLADMASKSMSGITDMLVNGPARKALVQQLRNEDPIIAKMTEQELMDAYHTIAKFAPTLATDKNAVKSALRQAAQYEGGLDYHTIKGLADAENSVSKARGSDQRR